MTHLPAPIASDYTADDWARLEDCAATPGSDLQFAAFVVGQHGDAHPMRRAQQAALEARAAAGEVRRLLRERDRAAIRREEAEERARRAWTARARRLALLDVDEHAQAEEEAQHGLTLRLRRWDQAVRAWREIEAEHGPVTLARIEEAEPAYWRDRLERQAGLAVVDRAIGGGTGNIDALRQLGQIDDGQIAEVARRALGGMSAPQLPDAGADVGAVPVADLPDPLDLESERHPLVAALSGHTTDERPDSREWCALLRLARSLGADVIDPHGGDE